MLFQIDVVGPKNPKELTHASIQLGRDPTHKGLNTVSSRKRFKRICKPVDKIIQNLDEFSKVSDFLVVGTPSLKNRNEGLDETGRDEGSATALVSANVEQE